MHPILFKVGNFTIGTYGLLLVISFLLSIQLAKYLASKLNIERVLISELAIKCLIVGIFGSKLLMAIVDILSGINYSHILTINYLRAGGAIHGGVISATFMLIWQLKKLKISIPKIMDCFMPALAMGQGLGRLGCFFAGCCYGTPSNILWSVCFCNIDANLLSGTPIYIHLHPVQLYTFVANIISMILLLIIFKYQRYFGQVSGYYFIFEGTGRIITESWRGDLDRGFIFGIQALSTGRVTSFLLIIFGIVLLFLFRRKLDGRVVIEH